MQKFLTIKCPKCGWEYLPCEIYYPNDFLGKTHNIARDDKGQILFFDNKSMDTHETFICEHCDCQFVVDAKIEFKSKIDDKYNFDENTIVETSIDSSVVDLWK